MILVDSSVWINHFNGNVTPAVGWLRTQFDLGELEFLVADLVLLEVLQGFRKDRDFELARHWLTRLPIVEMGGEAMAVKAATHYRFLRAKGMTIRKPVDCLIATFCIEEGFTLLHDDRDFDPFAAHLGLRMVAPPPQP